MNKTLGKVVRWTQEDKVGMRTADIRVVLVMGIGRKARRFVTPVHRVKFT
jgi:hypothetical protein